MIRSLLWGAASAALIVSPAGWANTAATAPARAASTSAADLATVVVTGTRALARTAPDSLSPIDVLSADDLAATGAVDLTAALRALLPSFNFPQPWVIGATDASMPAQLRGLAPDETLVLIDGKRQHTTAIVNDGPALGRGSSPVDLGAIPLNAVARVEVLRDGAAAQYGSDAIAGVINIILKHGAERGGASVGYGLHDGGQGRTWRGGADTGFKLGDAGWLRIAANGLNQNLTNHAGRDVRFPSDPTYLTPVIHFGLPKTIASQAAINGEYRFSDTATLYGFTLFNQRRVDASESFRSLSEYADDAAAVERYPAGYLPIEHSSIRDDSEVLGVRGQLAGWHYDASVASGGSHWKLNTGNTFNHSLGAASPSVFYIGTMAVRQNEANLDLNREFNVGWYGPLTVAAGATWRHEAFTIKHGDAASFAGAGSQVFSGFRPEDAGRHARHNAAAYIDLEAEPTAQWSAGIAARHERYSDFGTTTSWKLSARYQPTAVIALRGTASTGFRAPSLQQQFYSTTGVEFVSVGPGKTVPYTIRTFPVSDPAAAALGAQPLSPERSRNGSVGIVLTPAVGPYATLDLYQIDIRDRIILSGNLVGDAVTDYLTSVGIPFVSGGRFFTNAVETRTRGADVVATWPIQLATSTLKLTGGLNHTETTVRHIKPNPPQLGLAGLTLPVIDRDELGRITVGSPRSKTFLGADWSVHGWTLRTQATRYGHWTTLASKPANDQTFAARWLLDVAASYSAGGWTWTLGANNLTNVYPQRNSPANSFAGNIAYPWSSPFGFSGRYAYASAAYRW